MTQPTKNSLRASMLAARRALSPDSVRELGRRVAERVRTLDVWAGAREVLLYWPVQGEVDTRPLMRELWDRGARVILPRCRPDRPGEMDLACAAGEHDLAKGMYAVMEPDERACPALEACRPDLAVIPGVAFDPAGYRLGFGGGYYDRLLAEEPMRSVPALGLCYEFQLVDALPREPWDRPVSILCTEDRLWRP